MLQQRLHGNDGGQGAGALHGGRGGVAQVGVESLLVVGGEAQAEEPAASCVALRPLHQHASVALAPLRLRHHHRLHEEAGPVTYDPGEAGVAQHALSPRGAGEHRQADGELLAGLLQGVEPRALAPPPLAVDQQGAGEQQVWPLVDGHHAELLLLVMFMTMAMRSRVPRSWEVSTGTTRGFGFIGRSEPEVLGRLRAR